jgi:rRNA processing protein Gar1
VWVILDPEKSQIGAKVLVDRGSIIHTGGARKVIGPVKTVFYAIC